MLGFLLGLPMILNNLSRYTDITNVIKGKTSRNYRMVPNESFEMIIEL